MTPASTTCSTTCPSPDAACAAAVHERAAQILRPSGALAWLDELAEWIAGWQRTDRPRIERPVGLIFAADHGVAAAEAVSAYPTDVTAAMFDAYRHGRSTINAFARQVGRHRRRRRRRDRQADERHPVRGRPRAGALRRDRRRRRGRRRPSRRRPAGGRRDGHRQHDAVGGDRRRAGRRGDGGVGRARHRHRRRRTRPQADRRAAGRAAHRRRHRPASRCCARSAAPSWSPSPPP